MRIVVASCQRERYKGFAILLKIIHETMNVIPSINQYIILKHN